MIAMIVMVHDCYILNTKAMKEYNWTSRYVILLGAVHILRNTLWGGGGLPDLLQYYIGGGLLNLLQYYRGGVFKIYYNITVLKGKWKVVILFQL